MPVNIAVNKNYSHCPLKKRPVHLIAVQEDFSDEPENLSTKPEDLNKSNRYAVSPSPSPPTSTSTISPPTTPSNYTPSPPHHLYHQIIKREPSPVQYQHIKQEPDCRPASPPSPYRSQLSPEYAPPNWHRNVAPLYPTAYHPFMPYHYNHHEYISVVSPSPPYSDSSCSPPYPVQPLALRPTMTYSSIDQNSLSPSNSSSTTSPPPPTPEDLTEKRRQGVRHQCPDCGKSYSTFSGLSKHRQFHCAAGDGPRKSFSCKYCEKVYVSLGALKMHIRTHTLPCKCTMCGKAFSRPWLLQGHIRTHTGEKPFSCSYCNRAFADRSNLRAHLQTHSDVKKYSCPTCSKTFSRMSLLSKHAEGGCNGVPGLLHHHSVSDKLY